MSLLNDPTNLALMLAGVALVVTVMTTLHQILLKRSVADRLKVMQDMLEKQQNNSSAIVQQDTKKTEDDFFGLPDDAAAPVPQEPSTDTLPTGIRFV